MIAGPRVLLETDRLRLRAFTTADSDLLVELDGDPEVMRYINGGHPTSREFIERRVIPRFTAYDLGHDALGFWAAHRKDDDAFIGWFVLRPTSGDPTGELALGYRLRRSAWGHGYATEGARALIALAFIEIGARRVMAGTYEHNVGSRRVMEKAGMRLEGRYRSTPEELAASDTYEAFSEVVWEGDDVDYAINLDDWRASR